MDSLDMAARQVGIIKAVLTPEARMQYAVFSAALLGFLSQLQQESSKEEMVLFYGDVTQVIYDACKKAAAADAYVAFE